MTAVSKEGFKMETVASKNSDFSELTRLGIEFYEKNLKNKLEPNHNGEFVAIEPYLERYFLHKDGTQALLDARSEFPDKKFYLARVGYQYTDKISGSWLKKKAL